jgi:hypothetical protein
MSTLEQKATTEQRFAFFDDLFSGAPLPVTEPKPKDLATCALSDLITVALADLEATEKLPNYRIRMDEGWHEPKLWLCDVCLAGAVIARRLGGDPRKEVWPAEFPPAVCNALASLNGFRCGDLDWAFLELGFGPPSGHGLPDEFPVTPYANDPVAFKADMRALADMLRDAGM